MSLVGEIAAAHEGELDPATLVGEFRRTSVFIPVINDSLMSAEMDGVRWLYAFTDEEAMSHFATTRGAAPDTELEYVRAVGARLLDVVIPAVEGPAGVAVNVGGEQPMLFPPVSGVVPDSAAVDLAEPGPVGAQPLVTPTTGVTV